MPTSSARLRVLSVEVENNPGILFRVAGMIRRRGFNIEVLEIEDLTEQPRLTFQLALVKLGATGEARAQAVAEVERFGGHVVDVGPEQVIVQVAGEFQSVEDLLDR